MFSDTVLEKIFAMPDMQMLDLQTQSNIVHGMEKILEEEEKKNADYGNTIAQCQVIWYGVMPD